MSRRSSASSLFLLVPDKAELCKDNRASPAGIAGGPEGAMEFYLPLNLVNLLYHIGNRQLELS